MHRDWNSPANLCQKQNRAKNHSRRLLPSSPSYTFPSTFSDFFSFELDKQCFKCFFFFTALGNRVMGSWVEFGIILVIPPMGFLPWKETWFFRDLRKYRSMWSLLYVSFPRASEELEGHAWYEISTFPPSQPANKWRKQNALCSLGNAVIQSYYNPGLSVSNDQAEMQC